MPEALRIEKIGAGGPVAVLVGEHALQHEDLFALGMIVRREPRPGLIAHDGSDLPGLGRAHQVNALAPHRSGRAGRPGHPGRVGYGPDREISVDRPARTTSPPRRTPLRASCGSPEASRWPAGSPRRP